MLNPRSVLEFWFEDTETKLWFSATDAFDAKIIERFEKGAIYVASQTLLDNPHDWEDDADKALALVLVLDQFPRNMYRGTRKAFQWDTLAQAVSLRMLDKVWDFRIPQNRRAFVYMPLMHSENIDLQEQCVELCESRLEDGNTLFHAKAHRDLIKDFGRFPHRNDALGRESTPAELDYLASGAYSP